MTEPSISRAQPLIFGVAALGLTLGGWFLFMLSFTARERAWWNSLQFFALIYIGAIVLALLCVRSGLGIAALILATLSLGFISLFIFG